MMYDIFSIFDPYSFSKFMPTQMIMIMSLLMIISMQSMFWFTSRPLTMNSLFTMYMYSQLMYTTSSHIKGMSMILTTLFSSLIITNMISLNPYSMSLSSHLMFTMSMSLPLWMSFIISSIMHNPKYFIANYLPDSAPNWLNPFLILIETTSIMIQPTTLSFRLAANMSASHIMMNLLSMYTAIMICNTNFYATMLIITQMMYIMFEIIIYMIQAYIFCLLLSLYSDNHSL